MPGREVRDMRDAETTLAIIQDRKGLKGHRLESRMIGNGAPRNAVLNP